MSGDPAVRVGPLEPIVEGDADGPATASRRAPVAAPPPRPLVIELLGAPGSGKSTLVPAVLAACRDVGLPAATIVDAARRLASRTALGRLVAVLPWSRVRGRLLWEVFELASAGSAARRLGRDWPLVRQVVRSQWRRPPGAEGGERRVVHWYRRLLGAHGLFLARALPGEVLVIDEGFAHRAVQLFASAVEVPGQARVDRYLADVPVPDLLIAVHAPVSRCVERVRRRGVWDRFEGRDRAELERFVANAHRTSLLATRHARAHGWRLLEVDNGDDGDACASRVRREVAAHLRALGSAAAEGRWVGPSPATGEVARGRRRLVWSVPRPGRVVRTFASRRRGPPLSSGVVASVLDAYGTTLTGPAAALAMGWRNELVVASTSAGAVVVKRYPDRIGATGIRHEHSIIRRLSDVGFPVPPLLVDRRGSTWTRLDGRYFAVSGYVPGTSFAGRYLPPTSEARLHREAGALLAAFHDELATFLPEGSHHLGTDPPTGRRERGPERHLAALDELGRADGGREVTDEERWLLERRPDIAAAIRSLDRRLLLLRPDVGVIHGDYGLHNLTFAADGRITLHDLELARRDLLLIDVAVVLSRSRVRVGRAFLEGYATHRPLGAAEWAALPVVWEHYRWCGAVRSWQNFRERGGAHRLTTARRRVEEALRVAAQGTTAWE